jgi:hypothetical protein
MSNDRWEISNLIARYAELLNLGQIDELGELFRHGRITTSLGDDVYEGADGTAAMYRAAVVYPAKVPDMLLFTSNLQIEVDGDRASAKAYFLGMQQMPGGMAPVVGGRYHDEFRRIDGKWWFHHRHMLMDLSGDLSAHLTAPPEGL